MNGRGLLLINVSNIIGALSYNSAVIAKMFAMINSYLRPIQANHMGGKSKPIRVRVSVGNEHCATWIFTGIECFNEKQQAYDSLFAGKSCDSSAVTRVASL